MALPHRPADRHLAEHDVVDRLVVDADPRVLGDDRGQRPAALEADLEALVVEAEQQAVGRALRHAHREHARQPAAHGERLVRIDQRVDQLADPLLRHLAQGVDGVLGDRIPREQRNDVRHERRRHPFLVAQHGGHARAVARPQREDLGDLGIDARRRRRDAARRSPAI